MSVFAGDLGKAQLAAAMLLTLPGSPYLYYGEEIGMTAMKPDPNIREPFLWEKRESDKARTRWIEPKHSMDTTVVPAMDQLKDPASLLNFYKRLNPLLRRHSHRNFRPRPPGRDCCSTTKVFARRENLMVDSERLEICLLAS